MCIRDRYGWHKNKFIVGDPKWGIVEYREEELEAVWKSKTLMFMEPDESFKTKRAKTQLKRKWFLELLKNQKKVLIVLSILGLVSSAILVVFLPFIAEKAGDLLNSSRSRQFIISATFI